MKKILLFLMVVMLSGCNPWRCAYTHPDDMSPAMFEYCRALASAPDVYVNNSK